MAAIPKPYLVRRGALGWTLTDERAEPGSRLHYFDTQDEALALAERLELPRIYPERWKVLDVAGAPRDVLLVRTDGGQSIRYRSAGEAIQFLRANRAAEEQRASIRAERDAAAALLDVAHELLRESRVPALVA